MNLWGSLVQPPIQNEESPSKVNLIACSLVQVSLDISRDRDSKANLDPCTRAQIASEEFFCYDQYKFPLLKFTVIPHCSGNGWD